MTYIDYLNRFNHYMDSNPLPESAQLLYYKLLHIFNRAGWPDTVAVTNRRLGELIGLNSESAVISTRSKLVKAGFIQCQTGKNHSPNRYTLCQKEACQGLDQSIDRSIDQSIDRSIGRSVDRSIDQSHIKTKTKTKTKTTPPKPPKGASRPGPSYDIEELAALAVLDLPDEL